MGRTNAESPYMIALRQHNYIGSMTSSSSTTGTHETYFFFPPGFVQQGGDSESFVTDYAALRTRDGFIHPHQEHIKIPKWFSYIWSRYVSAQISSG